MRREFASAFNSAYAAPLAMPARLIGKCSTAVAHPFVNAVKNIANFFNGPENPPLFETAKSKPLTILATLGVLGVGAFAGLSAAMTIFEVANPLIFVIGIAGAFAGLAATPFVVGAGLMAVGAAAGLALSPLAAGYGVKKLGDHLQGHDSAPQPGTTAQAPDKACRIFRLGKGLAQKFRSAVEGTAADTPPALKPTAAPAAP